MRTCKNSLSREIVISLELSLTLTLVLSPLEVFLYKPLYNLHSRGTLIRFCFNKFTNIVQLYIHFYVLNMNKI